MMTAPRIQSDIFLGIYCFIVYFCVLIIGKRRQRWADGHLQKQDYYYNILKLGYRERVQFLASSYFFKVSSLIPIAFNFFRMEPRVSIFSGRFHSIHSIRGSQYYLKKKHFLLPNTLSASETLLHICQKLTVIHLQSRHC